MAKKAQSFKVDNKKKVIVIYNNVEQTDGERTVIEFYLKQGYTPKFDDKAKSKTVAEMKAELEQDEEALANFKNAYAEKNGFHNACKIYTDWVKAQKKEAKPAETK